MTLRSRILKYASAGAVGAVVHYATFLFLVKANITSPVPASAIASLFGGLCNYLGNYYFTFESKQRHQEVVSKFIAVAFAGWVVNLGAMNLFYSLLDILYLVAQVLSTVVGFFFNYIGFSKWVFHSTTKTSTDP